MLTGAVLLMGPTGSGKTDLAAALVQRFPFEIVSVDAAMVYRGMDIGTAKPAPELLARAPHHLIDLIDPAESYSAARFLADAGAAMDAIAARGHVPLLAGGTMLYFRALQSGLARLPAADAKIRGRLDARAAEQGWPALHAELARLDPPSAARIRPNDRQRIQRALEVIEATGRPLSVQLAEDLRGATRQDDLALVLAPADRAVLFDRVAARFDDMVRRGFVEEVRQLRARGDLHAGLPSIRLIGYRQLWQHLAGASTLEEASTQAIAATRQLARRQLTWLRAEPGAAWFDAAESGVSERIGARVAEWIDERRIAARRC
ncbi:MAG TPA: tRNA (adenosine(37)-N6)-dimethylallyltransferase MiaA [Steroidobacteraceae bacterium]|jgi:tRNA dimethylallyltransferase|nr:tRNA (adenosine(37)-N6)-dimethylallyltransferase MiaA [Steroidobacteraceae bacterium]